MVGRDGYEVSSFGRVRSWKPLRNNAPAPTTGRLLSLGTDKDGYKTVTFYAAGKLAKRHVAAVVCEAWHGPRPYGNVVRHLDGTKANDTPPNLSWGTYKENSNDSVVHGTWSHGSDVNTSRLSESAAKEIYASALPVKYLATQHGVTVGAIYHIKRRHTWKHLHAP